MPAKKKSSQPTSEGLLTHEDLVALQKGLSQELGLDLLWGDDSELALRFLSLGMPSYDRALGGGIGFNRLALVIGDSSAGKTTFIHLAIKAAQDQNLSVAYVDAERAWNPEWARALGVDISKMLIARPVTGEKAYDACLKFIKARVGLIIIDSLAALTPDAMLEETDEGVMGNKFMGRTAQMNNRGIQAMVNELQGSAIIAINQLRDKVGIAYGNPEVLPGGRGQRFYNSQTIRVSRGAWIDDGTGKEKKHIGYKLHIKLEKNKVGRPFEEGEAIFYFTGEFDETASIIEDAIGFNIIQGKPPHYFIEQVDTETGEMTTRKFYGRANLLDEIKADPELLQWIQDQVETVEAAEI